MRFLREVTGECEHGRDWKGIENIMLWRMRVSDDDEERLRGEVYPPTRHAQFPPVVEPGKQVGREHGQGVLVEAPVSVLCQAGRRGTQSVRQSFRQR